MPGQINENKKRHFTAMFPTEQYSLLMRLLSEIGYQQNKSTWSLTKVLKGIKIYFDSKPAELDKTIIGAQLASFIEQHAHVIQSVDDVKKMLALFPTRKTDLMNPILTDSTLKRLLSNIDSLSCFLNIVSEQEQQRVKDLWENAFLLPMFKNIELFQEKVCLQKDYDMLVDLYPKHAKTIELIFSIRPRYEGSFFQEFKPTTDEFQRLVGEKDDYYCKTVTI